MYVKQRLRPACANAQSDQSLYKSLEYSMTVKPLTEHHLEHLSLKGSCLGSSESTVVKIHVVENHMSQLICRKKNLCRSISTGFKLPDYADLYSLTANIYLLVLTGRT